MSGLVGADVDHLERVAVQFSNTSAALEGMRKALGARLNSVHWHGPDAEAVRHTWNSHCNLVIARAASQIHAASQTLAAEAKAQRDASASLGSTYGRAGSRIAIPVGVLAHVWRVQVPTMFRGTRFGVGNALEGLTFVGAALGAFDKLTRAASHTGRYTKAWDAARYALAGTHDLKDVKGLRKTLLLGADFKRSPVLQSLAHNHLAVEAGHLGSTKLVDGFNRAVGGVQAAKEAFDLGGDLEQHHYGDAAGHATDLVAAGLKSSKNPVTYLAGVDVSIYKDVFEAGRQVRWNEGVPNPLQGDNWKTIWAPALEDSVKQTFGKLLSDL